MFCVYRESCLPQDRSSGSVCTWLLCPLQCLRRCNFCIPPDAATLCHVLCAESYCRSTEKQDLDDSSRKKKLFCDHGVVRTASSEGSHFKHTAFLLSFLFFFHCFKRSIEKACRGLRTSLFAFLLQHLQRIFSFRHSLQRGTAVSWRISECTFSWHQQHVPSSAEAFSTSAALLLTGVGVLRDAWHLLQNRSMPNATISDQACSCM